MTTTWLYEIATNHCLNQLRNRQRRAVLFDQHFPAPVEHDDTPCLDSRITAKRLLAEATGTWAQAAVCVYVKGMSHREASVEMGVSRRSIGNFLDRFTRWAAERLQAPAEPIPAAS